MAKIYNLSQNFSLLTEWINELRDVNSQHQRMVFRKNLERVGEVMAYELSKKLNFEPIEIQTPLAIKESQHLNPQPVVMTILRAGIPLFNGVLNYFDKADAGFVGAFRKEEDKKVSIRQDYLTCPDVDNRPLILVDPMLATGSSLLEALKDIFKIGTPSSLHIVCAIAAQRGVDLIHEKFPNAYIWCGTIDPTLNDKNYIVPGLGDAGDLSFGSKLQNS